MSKPREGTDEGRCNPHARMPSKSIQCGRSGYIRLKCLSFHRLYSTQGATNQKIFSGISSTRWGLHGTLVKMGFLDERTPYLTYLLTTLNEMGLLESLQIPSLRHAWMAACHFPVVLAPTS